MAGQEQYGVLYQDPSNTAAHGMSSQEEAKYRAWDADPEFLISPQETLDAVRRAAAQRQHEEERSAAHERELGYIAVPSMVVE